MSKSRTLSLKRQKLNLMILLRSHCWETEESVKLRPRLEPIGSHLQRWLWINTQRLPSIIQGISGALSRLKPSMKMMKHLNRIRTWRNQVFQNHLWTTSIQFNTTVFNQPKCNLSNQLIKLWSLITTYSKHKIDQTIFKRQNIKRTTKRLVSQGPT